MRGLYSVPANIFNALTLVASGRVANLHLPLSKARWLTMPFRRPASRRAIPAVALQLHPLFAAVCAQSVFFLFSSMHLRDAPACWCSLPSFSQVTEVSSYIDVRKLNITTNKAVASVCCENDEDV